MSYRPVSPRSFQILSGLSGIVGVVLLGVSFAINQPPPVNASIAELMAYSRANYSHILWGAWLQSVGPVLIVAFAVALVHLAGATNRLAGWMTLFGAGVLMMVSLIEITFYISALQPTPEVMPYVGMSLITSSQHLYFMVGAPALFAPLGFVLGWGAGVMVVGRRHHSDDSPPARAFELIATAWMDFWRPPPNG